MTQPAFNGVAVCTPSSGRPVNIRWATCLPQLTYPVGMNVAWLGKFGSNRAENRNFLCEEAVKLGARFVFFIDDDTWCPHFTIRHLHAAMEKDPSIMVCGGIYCTKDDPPQPLVFRELGAGPAYDWKVGDIFDCKGLGTGCMLIRTEVFKHIDKPWFFEPDEIVEDPAYGEASRTCGTDDLWFCNKVSNAGFRIVAHGGVLPVHMDLDGKMYSLPLDSYPCEGMNLKPMPGMNLSPVEQKA